jgi:serine-aspartate repeat-containing protein C/D/E
VLRRGGAVAEVLKINGSGDVLWNKTYRSSSVHISIRRAVATSDGDFLLIGHSGSDATSVGMFAAKIGLDGTLRWSRTYDAYDPFIGNPADYLRDVAPTPDGGALLVGELFQSDAALAFKIDADGNVDWARMYGEQFRGDTEWKDPTVVRLPGGDFMLAGSAYNNRIGSGYDWVMRIDSGGNVRWVKSRSFGVGFMVPLSDGNLLLVGGAQVTGFPDVAAAKMTPDGVVRWGRRYGRAYADSAAAAAIVSDGGFLLAGLSSNDSGNEDLYLVRADATGSSGCLEQDLPVQVTPIDLGFIGTPIVQATDVALAVEALSPSVGTLTTQSVILCSDAMAWRLYLPLVVRGP